MLHLEELDVSHLGRLGNPLDTPDVLNLDFQVLIPLGLYLRVCRIFECVSEGGEKGFVAKQGSKIDYELLARGGLQEVRHVFARIVFDTVYPIRLN